MAYGIISIIGYLFFLIWVIVTAPIGDTIYRPTSTNFVNLAVAMGQAFSIQSFFIPILKKNNNTLRYTFYTFIAYIIGASVYLYIAYLGSFGIICRNLGILNRKPRITPPQTIEDFFTTDAW